MVLDEIIDWISDGPIRSWIWDWISEGPVRSKVSERINWDDPYSKGGVIIGAVLGIFVLFLYDYYTGDIVSLFYWGWNYILIIFSFYDEIWGIAESIVIVGAILGAIIGFGYFIYETESIIAGIIGALIGAILGAIVIFIVVLVLLFLLMLFIGFLFILLFVLILLAIALAFIALFAMIGVSAGKATKYKVDDIRETEEERIKREKAYKKLKLQIKKLRKAGVEPDPEALKQLKYLKKKLKK
jgi:hypothetical protein